MLPFIPFVRRQALVGEFVGNLVGSNVVIVGAFEGGLVGRFVGSSVGAWEGIFVGAIVGRFVGRSVGGFVGEFVGRSWASEITMSSTNRNRNAPLVEKPADLATPEKGGNAKLPHTP